jgi:hypothetical protein
MGQDALNAPVCAEIGMDVAGSLAVLAGRKSRFLIWVKLGLGNQKNLTVIAMQL